MIKQLYSKICGILYNHDSDLETRLGTVFISFGVIAAFSGLVVCLLAGVNMSGVITVGAIFIMIPVVMSIAYRVQRPSIGRLIMVIGVSVMIPVVWLTSGGLNSGCNVWFVFEFFFIALALRGVPLVVMILFSATLDGLCYWLSIRYPDLVWTFAGSDPSSVYVSTCGSVIIVSLALILTVNFQKKVYNHERETLLKTQESLERANNYQKEFLTNMSHEIRTPINAIIGMNEMILRENSIDEIKKYAHEIEEASQSMLAMVNDMLDITRLESGNMEIHCEEYSTMDLLNECFSSFKARMRDRNLDLFIKNNPKIPAKLYGDPTRLNQVVNHLLGNSMKMMEKGYVTLDLDVEKQPDQYVNLLIRVTDNGRRITKEELQNLYGGTPMNDDNHQSAGLGLAITKNLVNLMNGSLQLEAKEDGSCVTYVVRIPQKVVSAEPMGLFHKEEFSGGHAYEEYFYAPNASVLVVDDIDLNLKVIKGLLKKTQVQVDTALSGQEALEKCRVKKYNVIFMDHMMPEMDGIEAFNHIREEATLNKQTPVVMLTANAIVGAKNDYLQEGFADYISKPVKPDLLETVLRKFIA